MTDAEHILDELDPTPADAVEWPVSRRQTLRALASVGALAAAPGAASGQEAAGTGIADEAFFSNYGATSTAAGWDLTIDGRTISFDGSREITLDDGTIATEWLLPDGASAGEIVAPDGSVVFSVIPDSDVKYVAEDISANDGDAITSWSPSVGSISLDGGSPTYDVNVLNGNAVVVGDGSDDVLEATSSIATPDEMTVYIVAEPDRRGAGANGYITGNNIGTGDTTDTIPANISYFGDQIEYFNGSSTTAYTTSDDGYAIIGFIRSESSNNVLGRYNGVDAFNISPSTPASNEYIMSTYAESSVGGSYYNGGIAEIRVFDRVLDSSEYIAVESDLSDIYGIAV